MRIVIKIGTSTLAHTGGRLNIKRTEELCKIISDMKNAGTEVILVSSGAIGMGVGKLSFKEKPTDMPTKQAAAAVGQCELMYTYDKLFAEYNHTVAQILVTASDFNHDDRHRNFSNTLSRLLDLSVIPVINENDTIATEEIGIGDNDTLAAIVATSAKADLLVLLSDIDGLYSADPRKNPDAKLIPEVRELNAGILAVAEGAGSALGTGGMATKLHAAGICMENGCDMIITNGARPADLYKITDGEPVGTRFYADKNAKDKKTESVTGRKTTDIIDECAAVKPILSASDAAVRDAALLSMADALEADTDIILAANAEDMRNAQGKISDVMLDRLMLDTKRIKAMADGIRAVAALPDPTGKVLADRVIDKGLSLKKVSIPMGVVAIIYESRPNVTSDAAALCIKSGNVCLLRCGKEASKSAHAIVAAMKKGLVATGLPEGAVNILDDTSRKGAAEIMRANGKVDLLIPRGGAGLIRACVENATIPCIETGTGICSVYVDRDADIDMTLRIVENAKTQRPSVCNAEETLLVHRDIADKLLPKLRKLLVDDRIEKGLTPVELRLCERAADIIEGTPAEEKDYDTEFLDYILAVKIVDDVKEAVDHIAAHSTHHSDAIITKDKAAADYFTSRVDSAAVYVNASTRFTDGGEFGLGCEMGISTQKMHARGPMGLEELTCYKYIITGEGQIRK